jgi:RNA polymerase sigma factor (sigma-70 family)
VLFAFLALIENEDKKLDFEEIYYKYKDATFRRALRLLNNNHYDAEEAFQIAWCKIAKNFDGIETRNEQAISTYIMTTVEYSAIDVANSNDKWNGIFEELELDPEEYISDNLVFDLCATEQYKSIVEVIENMDKTYRDIMLMAFVYEMPIKKIAHHLNLKEKTVWTRFYRGKHILMELLKEKGLADEYCK